MKEEYRFSKSKHKVNGKKTIHTNLKSWTHRGLFPLTVQEKRKACELSRIH